MKSAPAGLISLLASGNFLAADCYTFTLIDNTVLKYTSFDRDVTYSSNTWLNGGPVFERSRTRSMIGLEVDTMNISIAPKDADVVGVQTWMQAVCSGRFDGAEVVVDQAFLDFDLTVQGTLNKFTGSVAQLSINRNVIEMDVNSPIELLNIQMPRNMYKPGCKNQLFDARCSLLESTWDVQDSVVGSPTTISFSTALTQGSGYFSLGKLRFDSGALSGTQRTVKTQLGGVVTLLDPLPIAPQVGDLFTIWPGCDKRYNTCDAKFGNLANFRGYPFIPVPETAL